MLNLDTHIFVFALHGNLTAAERRLLGENSWGLSAIVLWEIAKLSQLRRVDIDLKSPDFTRRLSRVHIWPLDLAVARTILDLDFSSDPADEVIAATSIVHHVPLVTRDKRILSSKLVPFPKRTLK